MGENQLTEKSAPLSKIDWQIITNNEEFQATSQLVAVIKVINMNIELEAKPMDIPLDVQTNLSPYQVFCLFFLNELWEKIVLQTKYMQNKRKRGWNEKDN